MSNDKYYMSFEAQSPNPRLHASISGTPHIQALPSLSASPAAIRMRAEVNPQMRRPWNSSEKVLRCVAGLGRMALFSLDSPTLR